MAIAALIIVGVLLVSSTLIASLLRSAESGAARAAARAAARRPASDDDEYSRTAEEGPALAAQPRAAHAAQLDHHAVAADDRGRAGGTLTPEQRRYMEVIRRNGRSLLALVDHLGAGRAGGACGRAPRSDGDTGG